MTNLLMVKDIYNLQEELNLPSCYEKFFNTQTDLPLKTMVTFENKLIFNLLVNLDETQFSIVYKKLGNIGLELLDYLNSIIYEFTISIDDERILFWLVYLYQDYKELYFVIWYLQYKYKMKQLTLPITFEDIPIFNFTELTPYLMYVDSDTKKLTNIFGKNSRGLSLL